MPTIRLISSDGTEDINYSSADLAIVPNDDEDTWEIRAYLRVMDDENEFYYVLSRNRTKGKALDELTSLQTEILAKSKNPIIYIRMEDHLEY